MLSPLEHLPQIKGILWSPKEDDNTRARSLETVSLLRERQPLLLPSDSRMDLVLAGGMETVSKHPWRVGVTLNRDINTHESDADGALQTDSERGETEAKS